jgi:hypothetical protein
MADKFILHVGFHKTGTTAIQVSLFSAQAVLLEHGIDYSSKEDHPAAWSLSGKVWGWAKRGGRLTPPSKWSKFVRAVNSSKHAFMASSEFFTELNTEQISKIKTDIKAKKYEIIFTIRPLAKMLASSYQQYLKYGLKADYEKWLHEMLDEPGSSKMTPSFWLRNFHGENINRWADVFGAENITVMVVDETKPDFLYEAFNNFLGLPAGTLVKQEIGGNRSLTAEEASMLQQLNKRFPKSRPWDDYSIFIRQTAIRALTDSEPHSSGTKLLTPSWAVEKAEVLTAEAVETIGKLGVNIIGDLQSLKNSQVPTGSSADATFMPVDTMIDTLLAFEQGVIRKMRWRIVLGEIPRRAKVRIFTKARMANKEGNLEDGE